MAFFPSMPDADMKDTLAREPAIGIPFSQLNEAVMRGDAPFTAGERELLAAYVSALHGCDYCQRLSENLFALPQQDQAASLR